MQHGTVPAPAPASRPHSILQQCSVLECEVAIRVLTHHALQLRNRYQEELTEYTVLQRNHHGDLAGAIMRLLACTKAYYRCLYLCLHFQQVLKVHLEMENMRALMLRVLHVATPGTTPGMHPPPAPALPAPPAVDMQLAFRRLAELDTLHQQLKSQAAAAVDNTATRPMDAPFSWKPSSLATEDVIELYTRLVAYAQAQGGEPPDLGFVAVLRRVCGPALEVPRAAGVMRPCAGAPAGN